MRRLSFIALLALAASVTAAPPPQPLGQLSVTTTPKGASIAVDGTKYGNAPATIPNLSTGDHLVVVTLADYEEARRTVTLTEAAPTATLELQLEPVVGLILVHTAPKGAEVQLNGADRGKTPLLLSDVPVGKHRVQLSIPGYQPKTIDLTVKDRTPQKIDVSMTSDSAKLTLGSDPTGAGVILNGIDKGKTPCTLDRIPAGDSKLEISMTGFEPYVQTLKLAAGQQETLTAVLKPIPSTLTVISIPPKARVYVNDQFKGESPVTLKNMAPGSYRVRAELKGFEADARPVELKQAQEISEEFRLAKAGGGLEVITDPPGVTVLIDGKEAGTTAAKANDAETTSQPLEIDLPALGEHEVQLVKKGYANKVVKIEIEKDKTATVKETLTRRFVVDCEVTTATDVYRGVLVEKDVVGNVTLEIKPGVIKTILAKDVRTVLPIKEKPAPKK